MNLKALTAKTFRNTLLVTSLCLGVVAVPSAAATAEQRNIPQTVLTVITSPDPQTQLMALTLTKASVQKGAQAQILLCGAAGALALNNPPPQMIEPLAPKGASPHGFLRAMLDEGMTIEVCAIYLPNLKAGKEVLLSGVGVAKPDAIADAILAENQKILSF